MEYIRRDPRFLAVVLIGFTSHLQPAGVGNPLPSSVERRKSKEEGEMVAIPAVCGKGGGGWSYT
jgi:hypothetical protein